METLIFFIILLIFGFYNYPKYLWVLFIGVYSAIFFDVGVLFWSLFIIVSSITLLHNLRVKFITSMMVKFIKEKGLLPKISSTEKAALEAGTNWVEADYFKGEIDFDSVKNEKTTKLSDEEKAFIDNEVEELCSMVTDWEIFQQKDIPKEAWDFIKTKKFFGMIIPKEYGGLGFSATAHSHIIEKLVSRSQVLAITVMVPNSLGPAELILKHGTNEQKKMYLSDLAHGKLIPCFGLTEPNAGSDATSITSNGVLFKDENDQIKIKLNFEKRYITLANIANLIGLAFQLKDPEHLLGEEEDLGITFGLIDAKTKGVDNSRRHDPLGIPFVNSPLIGKDVIIDVNDVIGGKNGIGKGWQMLVESLSIGRGISLPSVSLGGSKLALFVTSSYSQIREQFGLSINRFEGVEEKIAKISAYTYMLNAARNYTLDAIDNGRRPGVINSIMKYHATEKFREVINDSMDVLGGAAIIKGEKNLLAHAYYAIPISITVEGANILTRNLMQFGQGVIKSHPYIHSQIEAINKDDYKGFDKAFLSHVGLVINLFCKSIVYYFTRGYFINVKGDLKRYKQKLNWSSVSFALLSNFALLILGPALKKRENISARFGDMLSYYYLSLATIREYENNYDPNHKAIVDYICKNNLFEIQKAKEDIMLNLPLFKYLLVITRINPLSSKPLDALNKKIVDTTINNIMQLTKNIFIAKDKKDRLNVIKQAVDENEKTKECFEKIKKAIKQKTIKKDSFKNMLKEASSKNIISKEEKNQLKNSYKLKQEVISVDSYDLKEYFELR